MLLKKTYLLPHKVEVENPRKAQKKRENQKVTNWEKKKRKEQETG